MDVLTVTGLTKRFDGPPVVDGVELAIRSGECFGLLGPNGAGKTTTLRMCLGLTDPDAGSIRVLGFEVPREAKLARARIGVVPQLDNLDPDFTVEENLLVYGRYFGIARATLLGRIPRLLELAGLEGRAKSRISTLSGGMKRRLTLARALVNEPELLVLDEPTTGLDPQARHLIWDGLRQLVRQGRTLLLTTHFMDEAQRLCSRLAVMDHGRVIASGQPGDLIAKHVEPEVVEVYGDEAKAWSESGALALADRVEVSGETAFCYARDPSRLLADLQGRGRLRYLHRPANLEDLFLKLTGRELRD